MRTLQRRHNLTVGWLFLVVLLAVLATGAIGVAGADHGEPTDDDEIVEVQTVTVDESHSELTVDVSYHLGAEVAAFTVTFEEDIDVGDLDGFSQIGSQTFEWDGETETPSIETALDSNRSTTPHEGYEYGGTDEWLLVGNLVTSVEWAAVEPEAIDRTVHIQTPALPSVAGETILYIGDYDQYEFATSRESFDLVISDEADPPLTPAEIQTRLEFAAEHLDVGATDDPVTGFIVTDPLRRGGVASGQSADFWVHEAGLAQSQTTLWHEYVHTRQDDRRAADAAWIHEAEATYYEHLLALKAGDIEYAQFVDTFQEATAEYDTVVLAEPSTWEGTLADYELGGLTVAGLDATIREATDGAQTYQDVFRATNEHDGEITDELLEEFASSAAETSITDFFEAQIRSEPASLSVPPPTIYEAPPANSALDLEVEEVAVEPGETAPMTVTITNDGTDDALAPALQLGAVEGVELTPSESFDTTVTQVGEWVVFDHLAPGESIVFDYHVAVPADAAYGEDHLEATVEGMGGGAATTSAPLLITETPDAVLDIPGVIEVGETVTLDAGESTDDDEIVSYTWEGIGPEPFETETVSERLDWEFDTPGEYTVGVTVENERGVTGTATASIVATDRPSVQLDAPSTIEAGETVTFEPTISNEVGDYEVTWVVGDDEFDATHLNYTFNTAGDRTVTLIVEDEYGASTTETIELEVRGDQDDSTGVRDVLGPGFGVGVALIAVGFWWVAARVTRY